MENRKIYKVKEGEVTELHDIEDIIEFDKKCNWIDECLIAASSADEALIIANKYDLEEIDRDNIFYPDSYGILIVGIEDYTSERI